MPADTTQPSFPAGKAIGSLILTTMVLLALAWTTLPIIFDGTEGVRDAVLIAAAVVSTSAVLSILPVIAVGPFGVMPTVYAYFGGMSVRFVVSFAAALMLNRMDVLPSRPLLVSLVIFYFPLLMVEVSFVGRYLWQKDALGQADGASAADASVKPALEATK